MSDLKTLQVSRRPDRVRFAGRVLYLTSDPELLKKQLKGEDLAWTPDTPLRDDISTDEITPAWICYYFDDTLGDFPYLGLKAGGEFPCERGLVRQGGFQISVSGKRRGKGSSREQSPYAEMCAGILRNEIDARFVAIHLVRADRFLVEGNTLTWRTRGGAGVLQPSESG